LSQVHTSQYLDFSDSDSTRADAVWMSVTHAVRSGQMVHFTFIVQRSFNIINPSSRSVYVGIPLLAQSDLTGAYRFGWCTMEFTRDGRPTSASSVLAIVPLGYLGGEETLESGAMNYTKSSDFQSFYFGRPPLMSTTDTDFPTPDDDDSGTVSDAGETSICCMDQSCFGLPFISNA